MVLTFGLTFNTARAFPNKMRSAGAGDELSPVETNCEQSTSQKKSRKLPDREGVACEKPFPVSGHERGDIA